jgi:hypothetical protein
MGKLRGATGHYAAITLRVRARIRPANSASQLCYRFNTASPEA